MSATNPCPSVQGSKSQDVKTVRKRGRPAKSAICKQCQEEFPNAQLFRSHTANHCATNRQKKKRKLDLPKSRKESEVIESRQTTNINGSKQSMAVKNKTPNVRSGKKKMRSKITWTDIYSDDFVNEERNSDLDSPVVAKKCLNQFLKSKPNLSNKNVSTKITELAKGQFENGISSVKVESSANDSVIETLGELGQEANNNVIETLGELGQEANNNVNKTGGSDDFHLELKPYSVDIFPLNVSVAKPRNEQANEVNEGNKKLQTISLKEESNIQDHESKTVKEKDVSLSKSKRNNTVNHLPSQSKKSAHQNSQNRRIRKLERRRQWEIKREMKMRGAPNPVMDKGISEERKSSKVNRIKCHDLKLRIEKIDESGEKEMKVFENDTFNSILCNSKNKDDSRDTRPGENCLLYKPEKVRIKSGVVDDWLPQTCGNITKPNLENYVVPYWFSVSSPHSQTSFTETAKSNNGTAFLPIYSKCIVDAPIGENEGNFTRSKMGIILSDLPSELLISHIFPSLGPRELARLLRVNVRLNDVVLSYLTNITSYKMRRSLWSPCTKNCFSFMTRKATKLASINIVDIDNKGFFIPGVRLWRFNYHCCVTNKDVLRAIRMNPNLERIHFNGFKVSHKILNQLLLCEKLTELKAFQVGLWGTTKEEVLETIKKLKMKGVSVDSQTLNYGWPRKQS